MWGDDEWMRRVEQAEGGDATASAVLALYDSLMSHDDAPSRGCGRLMGRQCRLARLASLPPAPARVLMGMAAVLVDGASGEDFDDLAFPVVRALGDNPALPRAAYDGLERVYGGGGGVWFHYPNRGEPGLVFDDGWVERNRFPKCSCCGAPVDVDGEARDVCENEWLDW